MLQTLPEDPKESYTNWASNDPFNYETIQFATWMETIMDMIPQIAQLDRYVCFYNQICETKSILG